jgi:chromatin segregation and condensation protein Rec8/ScpA/Scc1 (kleisin family)
LPPFVGAKLLGPDTEGNEEDKKEPEDPKDELVPKLAGLKESANASV